VIPTRASFPAKVVLSGSKLNVGEGNPVRRYIARNFGCHQARGASQDSDHHFCEGRLTRDSLGSDSI
jgi:hypothetical protein